MKWTNIRLIVSREVRDQLRDRRTIFVIAILPLLLYPLLGMSFLQVAQFMKQHPTKVWVIGAQDLPTTRALLRDGGFEPELLSSSDESRLYDLTIGQGVPGDDVAMLAERAVESGQYDAVIYLPSKLVEHVSSTDDQTPDDAEPPGPKVFFNQAKDKSRVAQSRVVSILSRWRSRIVEQTLSERELPRTAARPFSVVSEDLSAQERREAAVWSKILPFIIIIWAMTGAFYPAIDLCAGEKERGTLETLLSSPASREEIVWGKLLTVMGFSIATSLLNLISMGLTGRFIVAQLQSFGFGSMQLGPPPMHTMGWLILVLIPIAALFSALSLALAAMARSSKEGQYYLMPLMLATMPLVILPMLPAVEMDLGNSLIPVTGVTLLLKSLIEGQYGEALRYAFPVISVTAICCWLATLWAIHQFQDENVLFHESEQFDLRGWLVHLVRDRGPIPTVGQAFLCAISLLLLRFGATLTMSMATDWNGFVTQTLLLQIGLIAGPAIVMALLLTRRPAQTLLLAWPSWRHLLAAVLLACFLHPVASAVALQVHTLYPLSEQTLAQLKPLQATISGASSHWQVLGLLALLPAICEELAFRGFILSGLRRMKNTTLAILVSSLFFGIAHQVLQQSLTAFALGMVIGWLAIRTESLLPCMIFHVIHNSLQLSSAQWATEPAAWLQGMVSVRDPGLVVYTWPVVTAGAAGSMLVLWLLGSSHRSPMTPQVWPTQKWANAS